MDIGENIRLLRIAKKMTQEELGEKVQVSGTMIGYIENGKRLLPQETGKRIAKALGCELTDLTNKEYQVLKNSCKTPERMAKKKSVEKILKKREM